MHPYRQGNGATYSKRADLSQRGRGKTSPSVHVSPIIYITMLNISPFPKNEASFITFDPGSQSPLTYLYSITNTRSPLTLRNMTATASCITVSLLIEYKHCATLYSSIVVYHALYHFPTLFLTRPAPPSHQPLAGNHRHPVEKSCFWPKTVVLFGLMCYTLGRYKVIAIWKKGARACSCYSSLSLQQRSAKSATEGTQLQHLSAMSTSAIDGQQMY
jgi:hypothetical protein